MRNALCLSFLLTAPSLAHDGGAPLFTQSSSSGKIQIGVNAKNGDVVWETRPSAPAAENFAAIIFQGKADDRRVRFEASLQRADDSTRAWGPWVRAAVEWFPNGRFWGKYALGGRKGDSVRLRAVNEGMAPGSSMEIFSMEMTSLKGEEPARRHYRMRTQQAAVEKPPVVAREEWSALEPTSPYEPITPWRITAHHTDGAQPMTREDAVQEMQIIQRFHQNGRGWIDIGYHFLVDGSGRIFQGRPENVRGAHVRDQNEGNVGVALMGGFHKSRNQRPTPEQIESLIQIARWVKISYVIDPAAFKAHRDYQSTTCPGDALYARLEDVRREIAKPEALLARGSQLRLPLLPPLSATERTALLRELFDGTSSR